MSFAAGDNFCSPATFRQFIILSVGVLFLLAKALTAIEMHVKAVLYVLSLTNSVLPDFHFTHDFNREKVTTEEPYS